MGLLLKPLPVQLIEECIRKVANGERWIEKSSAARVLERLATGQPAGLDGHRADGLTPRETELVELASTGLRNREIARRLGIAEGTVKVHLHNIYRKLGVRGRLQLAHYATTHGIV